MQPERPVPPVRSEQDYPGIVDDMRATYKKALTFPVEVFLSSHASFYNMAEKYAKLEKRGPGDPNPFVDPEGYKAHVAEYEKSFEAALARQLAQPQAKAEAKAKASKNVEKAGFVNRIGASQNPAITATEKRSSSPAQLSRHSVFRPCPGR